ncbi:McrB family protein [Mucilaginibacter sp.]
MPFQPNKITKDHILKAAQIIDNDQAAVKPSTKYDAIIGGKAYPPKHLMRLAHLEATGEDFWKPFGGETTNKYIKRLGFEVVEKKQTADPVANLVRIYKERIKKNNNGDETYKFTLIGDFQQKWDIDATDFSAMLRQINFSNLLYFNAIGVIRDLASRFPEEVRAAFKILFDEESDLKERVEMFQGELSRLYATVNDLNHHQDERTIATYLTFHNPLSYTFYKASFYSKYCKLLGIKKAKAGERYIHYLDLVDQFIADYIDEDEALKQLHAQYLQNVPFKDEDFKVLAQDILYQSLDLTEPEPISYYVVGSVWKDEKNKPIDQLPRFLKQGIWENGHDGENIALVKSIKPGSKIAIKAVHTLQKTKSVMTIKARGEVIENEEDGHIIKVNWEEGLSPFIVHFSGGYWGTAHPVTNPDHINAIFSNEATKQPEPTSESQITMSNPPLNQILFGPPGTGKTYHTMNKSLEIVGVDTSAFDRKSIKDEFEKRALDGQIMFTTFHQSMSYEDFIEGIKPNVDSDESESIKYRIEDGILKRLSRRAVTEFYKEEISKKKKGNNSVDRLQLYDEAWNSLVKDVQASLDNAKPLELLSLSSKPLDVIKITQQGNLVIRPRGENAEEYTVSYPRTQKLFEAYSDLSQVKNIDKEFRRVVGGLNSTAYWCVLNYLNHKVSEASASSTVEVDVDHLNEALVKFDNQIVKANKTASIKRFVLIIDEINRGNVSKVFGELITLVEKDKRLGEQEALEVTLPYSKERFGVPVNLYIIGTMNTADRSVEALDTALRRRFSFEEMQPNPSLLSPAHSYWKLLWDYKSASWEDAQYVSREKNLLSLLGASQELWTDRQKIWDQMEKEGPSPEQVSYFDGYTFNGVNLQRLLETINARIEVLKDRDHQIGHAYFIHVYGVSDLMNVFKDNIIPLLQEYFFGDYYKIQLVLGKGFIIQTSAAQVKFAVEEEDAFEEKAVYAINHQAFDNESNFLSALKEMKVV